MANEDIQLLLTDVCARLPYGLKVSIHDYAYPVMVQAVYSNLDILVKDMFRYSLLGECSIYLRPMSSMTREEQQKYYNLTHQENDDIWAKCLFDKMVDFCNEKHLDYRGLIEKGLALEAPEGMYKIE